MKEKNILNRPDISEATSLKIRSSAATDLKATKALNELSEDEQVSLVNKVNRNNTTNKLYAKYGYDDISIKREVLAKTYLKINKIEEQIEHLKKTDGKHEDIIYLEKQLEHQLKIANAIEKTDHNKARDALESLKIYVDPKDEAKKDNEAASKYENLSSNYQKEARIMQNRAFYESDPSKANKYLSSADDALKKAKNASDDAAYWHERAKKASMKDDNIISKTRRTFKDLQSNNAVTKTTRKMSQSISNALIKGLSGTLRSFAKAFASPFTAMMLAIIVCMALIISETGDLTYYVEAMENDVSDETFIEYSAWMEAFDDENERFYDDYHVNISSAYLIPMTYTYYNEGIYKDILNDYFVEHPYNHADIKRSEYLAEAYRYAVERYFDGMIDPYQLRELFLDKVEYQYQYLARSYSDWQYDLSEYEGYDEVYSYEKEVVVEDFDYVDHYRKMTSDECKTSFTTAKDIEKCVADPPDVLDHKSYEKVGEHIEVKTFYKARNITNEYFTLDIDDPDIDDDVHRVNVEPGYSKVVIPALPAYPSGDYSPDYEENISDHDSYWTYMYVENGRFIKRLRYWLLKDYKEVYEDVAYDYIPENDDDRTLHIKKNDHVIGEISFDIDRKYIYSVYFADDTTGIFLENVFLPEHNEEAYKKMEFLYGTFKELFSVSNVQFAQGKFLIAPFATAGLDSAPAITQHFAQIGVGNKGQMHKATDFAFAKGTDINAMADGTVVFIREDIPENTSSHCATSPDSYGCHGSIGNEIEIESVIAGTDGIEHKVNIRYYHVLNGSVSENGIKIDDIIKAGDIIAKVGHNGLSTGPHLHVEMKIDGQKVDCEQYIAY